MDIVHASAPLVITGQVRVFTSFIFTFLSIFLFFHTLVRSSVFFLAIATLVLISFQQLPYLVFIEPRYLKQSTSSILTPFAVTSCVCSSLLSIRSSLVFFALKFTSFSFPESLTFSTSSSMSLAVLARSAVSSAQRIYYISLIYNC